MTPNWYLKHVENRLMKSLLQIFDASNGGSAATGIILNSWLMHEITAEDSLNQSAPAPDSHSDPAKVYMETSAITLGLSGKALDVDPRSIFFVLL